MTSTTALDPTKPNTPERSGRSEQLTDGRTTGTWYRWVDTPYVEQAMREGLVCREGWREGSHGLSLWQHVYGEDTWPVFVSRDPHGWNDIGCMGQGSTLLAIDADGLRLAPDYNMVDEEWHDEYERDGFVQLRDYNDDIDGVVIATYTLDDLRTQRVAQHLLFEGYAACIVEPVEPGRIQVVSDPMSLPPFTR